jgi:hypothetical protein
MYKVEFVKTPSGPDAPVLHSELALTKSVEEAKDFADTHLPAVKAKFGANSYRIVDENNIRIAIGPEGYRDGGKPKG